MNTLSEKNFQRKTFVAAWQTEKVQLKYPQTVNNGNSLFFLIVVKHPI